MTDAEADKWYADLMAWIAKNHPHLEKRWWEKPAPYSSLKHSRYSSTRVSK